MIFEKNVCRIKLPNIFPNGNRPVVTQDVITLQEKVCKYSSFVKE